MGDLSRKIDVGELISYSDDLIAVLKEERDINNLTQSLHQFNSLRSSSDVEFDNSRNALEDYDKKIEDSKQKTEKAKLEVSSDEELGLLHKELEVEHEKERLLMEELRVINDETTDLERQRSFVKEQREIVKKLEQEDLKARLKLSMYACVTNLLPILDDPAKIAGRIVDRDKKVVETFKIDPSKAASFDTCQSIWKMINVDRG